MTDQINTTVKTYTSNQLEVLDETCPYCEQPLTVDVETLVITCLSEHRVTLTCEDCEREFYLCYANPVITDQTDSEIF